jgi:integrase
MARPRKDYRVKLKDRRGGRERFELFANGQRFGLQAATKAEAEAEGAERYRQMLADEKVAKAAPGPQQPAPTPQPNTLRAAVTAYFQSEQFRTYKVLTVKGQRSTFNLIMLQPATAPNRNVLGDSLLSEWLQPPWGSEAVLRVMAACGNKVHAANKRLLALNQLFSWLLSEEPEAATARATLKVSKAARNPCIGIEKPKRRRDGKRHGHLAFTDDDVAAWLHACKDDPEQHRAVRLMQIIGSRVSDLYRLNLGMIKATPAGKVLTFKQEKGRDSLYREGPPPDIVIPWVPELQAIIDELPADRFCFIHSVWDQPFKSAASMSMKVRKWRRDCGLPEGLSAHGMRKSATHWWLRNYRDLIGNDFSLKAIFGWVTTKELERYTRDFNRQAEAEGMLIKLSDRRSRAAD